MIRIGSIKKMKGKISTESDKPVFEKPRVIKHHHQDKVRQILDVYDRARENIDSNVLKEVTIPTIVVIGD